MKKTIIDPTDYKSSDWYRGIEGLKKTGVKTKYTQEMRMEVKRCSQDIEYFCEKYVYITDIDKGITKFKARDYQKEFWKTISDNRFVISKQGRQAGKTAAIVGYLLWYSTFHKKRTIGVAAQNIGQAREIIHRFKQGFEALPSWLQVGVSEWQKGGVTLGNGTRIFASSSNGDALRGKSLSLLILDEFAHIRNDAEFMESTFPVVSSGKKSKIVIISTPNGMGNAFYDIWKNAEDKGFKTFSVHWRQVPRAGWDDIEEWGKFMKKSEGIRRFSQEYAAEFVGSSNTLVDGDKIESIINACGEPIRMEENELIHVFEDPDPLSSYIMTVDVGRGYGNDYSTFSIWKVGEDSYEQVLTFRDNYTSTQVYPYIINKYAKLYNDAYAVVERNDAGGAVADSLYFEIEYANMYAKVEGSVFKTGMWTSVATKRGGCSNLRDMMDVDKVLVRDERTALELRTFVGDKSGSYNATTGNHDDMVQNCWLLAFAIEQPELGYFITNAKSTKELAHQATINRLMNELPAVGNLNGASMNQNQREIMIKKLNGDDRHGSVMKLG